MELVTFALSVAGAFGTWWLLRARVKLGPVAVALLLLSGALAAAGSVFAQRWLWGITGIDLASPDVSRATSLATHLAFVAPLEGGLQLLVLWPFLIFDRLKNGSTAVFAGVLCSAGFSAMAVWALQDHYADHATLRVAFLQLGRLFFTSCWAGLLGTQLRYAWLRLVWIVATILYGLFLHLLSTPGPGSVLGAVPALLAMGAVSWLVFRRLERAVLRSLQQFEEAGSPSEELLNALLRGRERRILVHWVVLGLFVTLGVVIAFVTAAVYIGHRAGIDFALADESALAANGPLSLLGAAILAAFPASAYLVARASGTRSVIEPALGAASALFAAVGLLSLTAPAAVVFAVAVAPVAFALACIGAWFGLARD